MLSPDLPGVSWILAAVFAALVALLVVRAIRKDRQEYPRFKRLHSTAKRQAMFRKWLRESFLSFGGIAVVLLALVWQFIPLLLADINGWDALVAFHHWFASAGWVSIALTALVVLLAVVLPVLLLFVARRESPSEVAAVGDIQAILPRTLAEVRLGALLSLNAGILEELVFRLAVPALIYAATGNALVALIVSTLLFGALHAYQGLFGVLGTALIGAFFMLLYIVTGTILVPIIAHLLVDLRSFVFIPLIVLRVGSVGREVSANSTSEGGSATEGGSTGEGSSTGESGPTTDGSSTTGQPTTDTV